MTAGNSASRDELAVMPCATFLFLGKTVQFPFFPEGYHHHLVVGYDTDAFIFPVEVLLPMKNLPNA